MKIIVPKMCLLNERKLIRSLLSVLLQTPYKPGQPWANLPLFFRIQVTQGASPDKDLNLALRQERQR